MIKNEFVVVAAIHKCRHYYHIYCVRKSSEIYEDIVKRLLEIENVEYGNINEIMPENCMEIREN